MKERNVSYTETDIQEYIDLLGCWRYTAPRLAVTMRDPEEYSGFLEQCIRVNMHRRDSIGKMERDAARRALRELSK